MPYYKFDSSRAWVDDVRNKLTEEKILLQTKNKMTQKENVKFNLLLNAIASAEQLSNFITKIIKNDQD